MSEPYLYTDKKITGGRNLCPDCLAHHYAYCFRDKTLRIPLPEPSDCPIKPIYGWRRV